jgi:antitoxin ParD1/3/4
MQRSSEAWAWLDVRVPTFQSKVTLPISRVIIFGRNNSYREVSGMASVEKISIALPPEMVATLRQAVDTGEYASSSEVVRDALRDWTHKRQLQQNGIAELRQLWQQAREDKTPGVAADPVLDRLERKYQALADAASENK